MTRWCPVCESPGLPVTRGEDGGGGEAVEVSRDLPGIDPTHFCSRCPTFFRSRDRFYLTAQHEIGVHGIAVWPHHDRHVAIEVGEAGLVACFEDGATVLISRDDTSHISTSFFRTLTEREIVRWAARRGFELRLVPTPQPGVADLVVDRSGPHFMLVVTKAWFQSQEIRRTEDGIYSLESIGVEPVLFPPAASAAG